jgi:hypothetical protein
MRYGDNAATSAIQSCFSAHVEANEWNTPHRVGFYIANCIVNNWAHHIHNALRIDPSAATPQKRRNASGIAGCTVDQRRTRAAEKVRDLLSGPARMEIQASEPAPQTVAVQLDLNT